jgi:hypothetical protein
MASKESSIAKEQIPQLQGFAEAAHIAEETLQNGLEKGIKLVKKYPLESALVCFGVGVVVAGLFMKSRD